MSKSKENKESGGERGRKWMEEESKGKRDEEGLGEGKIKE